MTRRSLLLTAVFVSVGLCLSRATPFAAAAADPKLDLRPRFVVGQENRFVVDMHSKTESHDVGSPVVKLEEYQQRVRLHRKVIEASESGATLEIKYEAVIVNLVAGNRSVYFDSEGINGSEPEEALGSSVRNAIGRTFTVKVDATGRFQSVSGNTQDGTKVASRNLIGDDLFQVSLAPIYGPGKEPPTAAVGETWSSTRQSAPSKTGQFSTTITSTLSGLDAGGSIATIDIGGRVELTPSEKAKQGKAEIGEQRVAGQQAWNVLAGVMDRSAYLQSMQLRAEVEVTNFATRETEVRNRRVDTLRHVVVQRIDDGVAALPPLAADLAMAAMKPPPSEPAVPGALPTPAPRE